MKEKKSGLFRLILRLLQGVLIGVAQYCPVFPAACSVLFLAFINRLWSFWERRCASLRPMYRCSFGDHRRRRRISRRGKNSGIFPGKISGPVSLPFYWPDYRNAALPVPRGRREGPPKGLLGCDGDRVCRDHWTARIAEYVFRDDLSKFGWYIFCGFCLALSVIAPGMSFSTLLMPLGLYTPFVDGLGSLSAGILAPAAIGAVVTVICLAKAVDALFDHFYPYAFHAIIGIVIAATIMIIPVKSFTVSATAAVVNVICLAVGIVAALALDKFNSSINSSEAAQ